MNRFSLILLSAFAVLFLGSCEIGENSIAEFSEEDILEGNIAIAAISEAAFGEGDKSIVATSDENVFYYLVDDQADADDFIAAVTCGTYISDYYIFSLAADMGTVEVMPSGDESCYYIVDFEVVTLPEVRYILVDDLYLSLK